MRKNKRDINHPNESRGVSEAVSQGLLFLTIMAAITLLSGTVAPIIDTAQQSHTIDQTVISFGEIDDVSNQYRYKGSQDEYTTANHTIPVNTYSGTLETPPSTEITLDGEDPPFDSGVTITSDPIRLTTSNYDMTYDTGIIQYEEFNQSITYRTPSDTTRTSENIFTLVTHDVKRDFIRNTTQNHQLIISERNPPERGVISDRSEITIRTENSAANGWVTYLESLPYMDNVGVEEINDEPTRTEVTADITEETVVYHHKLNVR
jgi:hypothetical protein